MSKIPAWRGAQDWLHALEQALTSRQGDLARRGISISLGTVLDVAAADAGVADGATGRNVATSHDTVAGALGCSKITVRRARALIEALGYARTIAIGRYLTATERGSAAASHGGRQLRVASTRVLTIPRSHYPTHTAATPHTGNEHLPRRGVGKSSGSTLRVVTKRAHARPGAAARPKRRNNQAWPTPDLAIKRQAAALAAHLPWLDPVNPSRATGHQHIGQLWEALAVLGIDGTHWTWRDLLTAINARNADRGWDMGRLDRIRNRTGYLITLGRAAMIWWLEHHDHSPGEIRRAHAEARAHDATTRAAEHAETAQRRATNATPETRAHRATQIAAIRAAINAATATTPPDDTTIPLIDDNRPKAWGPR